MSLSSLAGYGPVMREAIEYALEVGRAYGLHPELTSTVRPLSEQRALYARYLACKARGERIHPGNKNPGCRYPAAAPGESAHNYGLAFDSWVPEGEWEAWNHIRAAVGFHLIKNDRVHAEYPGWRSIRRTV